MNNIIKQNYRRSRPVYLVLATITIVSGLASRHYSNSLPPWVQSYLGDALWALMVFLLAGFIFHAKSTRWVGIAAMAFSYCIEISQLYHAPWIDALRSNWFGGLVLGFGFLWSDLVCYTVGIGVGVVLEKIFFKNGL